MASQQSTIHSHPSEELDPDCYKKSHYFWRLWLILRCRNAMAFAFNSLTHLYFSVEKNIHISKSNAFYLFLVVKKKWAKYSSICVLKLATFGSLWAFLLGIQTKSREVPVSLNNILTEGTLDMLLIEMIRTKI